MSRKEGMHSVKAYNSPHIGNAVFMLRGGDGEGRDGLSPLATIPLVSCSGAGEPAVSSGCLNSCPMEGMAATLIENTKKVRSTGKLDKSSDTSYLFKIDVISLEDRFQTSSSRYFDSRCRLSS